MTDKWNQRYINLAKEVATWSKDPSRKIGAVAVSAKGQVLATGYNGFPRGMLDTADRYADRPTKYKYIVHAEMNCIYNATYNGVSLDGATMYVWGLPVCSECAKGIIQVGITKVYWATNEEIPPKWLESLTLTCEMFREAKIGFNCLQVNSEEV
jgi:dCMP deaminase